MKNFIDDKFYNLISQIEKLPLYEKYIHMVKAFSSLNIPLQISIENYINKFNYWGTLKQPEYNYELFFTRAKIFKNNIDDYVWLYENLNDYKSKYVLFAIINNNFNFVFTDLDNVRERIYKHYFDMELLSNLANEVFVDVGTFTGDSVIDYINTYGENSYKKIFCYEMDEANLQKAKNNLKNYKNVIFKHNAVSDKKNIYNYDFAVDSSANCLNKSGHNVVEGVSLDEDISFEDISLIKMDIEGAEKNAIIGAKNIISKKTPKLLISVYHNNTDLFELPKIIKEYNPKYKLYLRYYGGQYFPTEIVLFAV